MGYQLLFDDKMFENQVIQFHCQKHEIDFFSVRVEDIIVKTALFL